MSPRGRSTRTRAGGVCSGETSPGVSVEVEVAHRSDPARSSSIGIEPEGALTAERLVARIDTDRPDDPVADRHREEIFPGGFAWAENAGNERLELVYDTSKSAPGGEEPVRVFEVLRR